MKTLLSFIFLLALHSCSPKPAEDAAYRPKPDIKPVLEVPSAPENQSSQKIDNNSPGPEISFERNRFSFGQIYHAEKVTHDFTFTNTGDRDLMITSVRASCGCTTPTYSKDPVAPGETGVISVLYNSVGKQGTQKATIRVGSNDPVNPEIVLYLSGRVLVKPQEDKQG